LIVFEGGKDQAFVGGGDGRRSGMRFGHRDKALPMFPTSLILQFYCSIREQGHRDTFPGLICFYSKLYWI
jgi:hypothetical protein